MENLTISKKANVYGNVFSYGVVFNPKNKTYRVNEYKNGEFENQFGKFKNKQSAIEMRDRYLTAGETAITL